MIKNITYPYKTHYIDLPGNCNVAYVDEGKGEKTLLFIHGLANYALVWKKNIDQLKDHYRCIAIDLPGNGLSDHNPHKFSMKFFARCVADFIEALGLEHLCIVGHSMGGQIAVTTVLGHPACAEALVLCAPAGLERFTALDKSMYYSTMHLFDFISSDEQSLRSTIESGFHRHHSQAEHMVRELTGLMKTYKMNYYRKMVEACIKSMLEEPVLDQLHLVRQPALILFGRQDALIPNKLLHHVTTEKIANEAAGKMPAATLKMLPDCGHFIQWEKAEEVDGEIVSFLNSCL